MAVNKNICTTLTQKEERPQEQRKLLNLLYNQNKQNNKSSVRSVSLIRDVTSNTAFVLIKCSHCTTHVYVITYAGKVTTGGCGSYQRHLYFESAILYQQTPVD